MKVNLGRLLGAAVLAVVAVALAGEPAIAAKKRADKSCQKWVLKKAPKANWKGAPSKDYWVCVKGELRGASAVATSSNPPSGGGVSGGGDGGGGGNVTPSPGETRGPFGNNGKGNGTDGAPPSNGGRAGNKDG